MSSEENELGLIDAMLVERYGAERWAELKAEARRRLRAKRAHYRRIGRPRSPLSSKHRAGSRANKHRRTVPTFASDRRTA